MKLHLKTSHHKVANISVQKCIEATEIHNIGIYQHIFIL